ncbi:MAG: ABC transporter permease [Candidatus Aminicenantes bacterium]|nr:ABC transporter permease [Candidatus Aminicenantes bacterium]
MIKNYLKTAVRNLFKHKGYTFINILGLAIGMAACLLILLYVRHELSYDGYHQNSDPIYRIAMAARWGGRDFDIAVVPAVTAKTMVADFPEVEDAVRFRQRGDYIVQYKDQSFREDKIVFTDTTFFKLFSIPLLKGEEESALAAPYSIVLSKKTAEKYFGNEEPIGKTLKLDNRQDYNVTGVFEEIPDNTHFHFDILLSLESIEESRDPGWVSQNFQTYILLRPDADPATLEAKFPQMLEKYMWPQFAQVLGVNINDIQNNTDMWAKFYLQPLKSIHLHSNLLGELEPNSYIRYIYIFSAIALFILIIASINFMNLSTAKAAGRAKEVGLRKVLGSQRKQLILQYLIESTFLSLISMIFAVGIVLLALPAFNQLSGKSMEISSIFLQGMPVYLIMLAVLTGFFAGSYPAFFISAFQPIQVLRGKMKIGVKSGVMRSALVIFQFTASIILIIGTMIVFKQLRFIQNKNLGFNKEQVLILDNAYLLENQAKTFKDTMKNNSQFLNASISGYLPVPSNRNNSAVFPEGERDNEHSTSFQNWIVDYDYLETMGMKLVEGRFFSKEFSTDNRAAVINQSVARQFNWPDPLGKRLGRIISQKGDIELYTVIGVVEDFHFESLRENIGPLVMYLGESRGNMSLRLKTQDVSSAIGLLERKWKQFLPNQPFEYSFLDERFEQMYQSEQKIGKIFTVFASLAIFIGCLGLFGLAAFTAEQRTKEIGIRKVLGASSPRIIRLLLKEFVILVGIANLIAWPIAYLIMKRWLMDFAYRISPSVLIFITAGTLTLLVAILTVSFQAVKAALADPIRSLRYE